jgi:hypothetical protein
MTKCPEVSLEDDEEIIQESIKPYRALLSAILERAVFDLYGTNSYENRMADVWITSRAKGSWSFIWVCQHLDFDHKKIKKKLLSRADSDPKHPRNLYKQMHHRFSTRSQIVQWPRHNKHSSNS